MDFDIKTLDEITKNSIKENLVAIYNLGKSEEDVRQDIERGIKNIRDWIDTVCNPYNN